MVAIFAVSMPAHAEWIGGARPMMGTEVSVLLWHDDVAAGEQLLELVFAEAERIDKPFAKALRLLAQPGAAEAVLNLEAER